jgi:hypothetical protein
VGVGSRLREKHINGYTYLYLVESVREDGRAKQRIIKNLVFMDTASLSFVGAGGRAWASGAIPRTTGRT